jgi:hypothetical protein
VISVTTRKLLAGSRRVLMSGSGQRRWPFASGRPRVPAELSGPSPITERQLRELFIRGKTPVEAAQADEAFRRPAFQSR